MKKSLLIHLVLSSLLILGIGTNTSRAQSWEPANGPYGGNISCFTENSEYLFAGSPGGVFGKGIFRSADHGANWTSVNNGLSPASMGKSIDALGTSGGNVVATTGQGVYYSANNGDSWSLAGFPGQYYPLVFYNVGNDLFAGGSSGLYVSADNGITFTAQNDNFQGITPPAVPEIRSFVLNGTTLYTGTYRKGIFRSVDNGLTWTTVNDGLGTVTQLNSRTFGNLAVSGTNVFAGTYGQGVFRLINNGTTWTQEITGLPTGYARNVISMIVNDSYIYITTGAGIYRSANSDVISWSLQTVTPADLSINKLFPSGSDIFASTNKGVHISADTTATWTQAYHGMLGLLVDQISTAGGNEIIAAMNTGNYFRSSDFGETWEIGNMAGAPFFFNNYLFLYNDNGWIYRSSDNGATWQQIYEIGTLTRFSSMGSTLFARITCCEIVWYSTDNGSTWTPATGAASQIFCMANDGTNLFAGTQMQGVIKSVDNGVTWTGTALPMDIPVRSVVTNGTYVFAGTSNFYDDPQIVPVGIYRSGDNGNSWQLVNSGLGNLDICSMVFNGTDLYAGTKGGVFKSTNNGDSWVLVNDGFSVPPVAYSLFVADNYLFTNNWVPSIGGPVYRRLLSGSAPEQPSPITGSAYPCTGSSQTYSVTNVAGVTYTWQVPNDWVIESGNGTNSIIVTVGTGSGIVLVTPSNGFGTGLAQYLNVSAVTSIPAQPGPVAGPVNPVINTVVEYSVALESGVTYTWAFPEGWVQQSGANSNVVTVLVGENAGDITVTPSSSCGTGEPALLTVEPVSSNYPAIFAVTGGGTYCEGDEGLPVGLSGSQTNVIYTLYQDGVAQTPTVAGTGNALSFGNQPEGTYTVFADNGINAVQMDGNAVITAAASLTISVVITADDYSVCTGTEVTLSAIPQNGGTPYYQWYVNNNPAGTNQPTFTYAPADGDQVYVNMTSSFSCTNINPAASNSIEFEVSEIVTPSVTIVASENPVIAGNSVTFTAAPVNGGDAPQYLWFVNGVNAGTGASYTYLPADGDQVYAIMTSSLECVTVLTVLSNTIQVDVITGTGPYIDGSLEVSSRGNILIIEKAGGFNGLVKVYNITGQHVLDQELSGQSNVEIPIRTGSGIYMVSIMWADKQLNTKVYIR